MNQAAKALALSRQALALIEEELKRKDRWETIGMATHLLACKRQLSEMIAELESGNLPPPKQRMHGMGHMIADSWPTDSKLADALLAAEQAYRRA